MRADGEIVQNATSPLVAEAGVECNLVRQLLAFLSSFNNSRVLCGNDMDMFVDMPAIQLHQHEFGLASMIHSSRYVPDSY